MMSPGDLPSQVQPPAEKCTRSRVQRTAEHSVERRDTQVSLQKHSLLGEKQTVSLFVQNWWKKTEERFLCLAQSVPIVMISTWVWWSWLMEPNIKMTKRFLLCVHTLFCYILFPWADVDLLGCNIPYRRPKVFIGLPSLSWRKTKLWRKFCCLYFHAQKMVARVDDFTQHNIVLFTHMRGLWEVIGLGYLYYFYYSSNIDLISSFHSQMHQTALGCIRGHRGSQAPVSAGL